MLNGSKWTRTKASGMKAIDATMQQINKIGKKAQHIKMIVAIKSATIAKQTAVMLFPM